MKSWQRVVVQYPRDHLDELTRAAKDEGISRSSFIVRTMRDVLNQEAVTGKLFRSQSFRLAMAEMITRPDVMGVLNEAIQADPAALTQVRKRVESEMQKMARGTRRPGKKRGQAKG